MNKLEIQSEIDNVTLELRSLMDSVKDTSKEVNAEEVRTQKAALEEKRAKLIKDLCELDRPVEGAKEDRGLFNADKWLKAAKENRSITIGDSGAILQIKNLFKNVAENDDLLNAASFYYGPNASTNIPVLAPMSDPTAQAEGSTGVGTDSDAAVSVTKLEPYAYARVLPISAEMLGMGSINLEGEVNDIFARAFRKVMHKQMLTGTGASGQMKGIFVSAAANTSGVTELASTVIKISELARLALKVSAMDEIYSIVMNPSVYQGILADGTDGEDVKLYKEGLIRDKSIEGVKVILDSNAPTATAAGSILAAAVPLERFAIGVAGEMTLDPIKVKGDTNTYFQAVMFFNGKQIADSDIYSLAVKA